MLGKRKRKSERDLQFLRSELKKEFLWSRDKIMKVAAQLEMNETKVYKWWWDQAKKRQKMLTKRQKTREDTGNKGGNDGVEEGNLMPSTDEFGGYSSRLRLHEIVMMES